MNPIIECPDYEPDCPYYHSGLCTMYAETGDHPVDECDTYYYYNGDESDDE